MDLEIGKNYFVRTLTDYWIGRLVSVDGPFTVTLEDACWVAETGRLHVFLRDGKAQHMEIEAPVERVTAGWVAIIPWRHEIFTESFPK